jgi:cobalamin biosynthesis protein CobD/CbiB
VYDDHLLMAWLESFAVGLGVIVLAPAWYFWFGGALRPVVAEENGPSR